MISSAFIEYWYGNAGGILFNTIAINKLAYGSLSSLLVPLSVSFIRDRSIPYHVAIQ